MQKVQLLVVSLEIQMLYLKNQDSMTLSSSHLAMAIKWNQQRHSASRVCVVYAVGSEVPSWITIITNTNISYSVNWTLSKLNLFQLQASPFIISRVACYLSF